MRLFQLTQSSRRRAAVSAAAVVTFLFSSGPAPLRAAAQLPAVEEILAKHIDAAGGEKAIRAITSRRMSGTLTGSMVGQASWELWSKAPNKRLTVTEVTGYGTMLDGYDGKVSWTQNPFAGNAVRSGEEAARSAREAQFYQDLDLHKLYPDLKVTGAGKVGDADTWVLESHPSPKSVDRFHFSQRTGRLLQHESEFEGDNGRMVTRTRFADFRKVDGLSIPHRVELSIETGDAGEFSLTLTVKKVEHNLEIPDAKFKRPGT